MMENSDSSLTLSNIKATINAALRGVGGVGVGVNYRQRYFSGINIIMYCAVAALTLQFSQLQQVSISSEGSCDMAVFQNGILDAPTTTKGMLQAPAATEDILDTPTTTKMANLRDDQLPLPRLTTNEVVIMVLGRSTAVDVRNAIRSTWAKDHDNVYFVIGRSCTVPPMYRGRDEGGNPICTVANRPLDDYYLNKTLAHRAFVKKEFQQIKEEQQTYQDILLMDEFDVYRNLPQKLKYAYSFVEEHLSATTKWIVKVDDDFFMQVDKFSDYLLHSPETSNYTTRAILVGGDIRYNHAAHTQGKWQEVPQFPRGADYPPFPLGSYGHAVTRRVSQYIVHHQKALFDYQGEDVSIGIWLSHPNAPKVDFVKCTRMKNNGNCRDTSMFVVGHDVTPSKMKSCQQAVDQRKKKERLE